MKIFRITDDKSREALIEMLCKLPIGKPYEITVDKYREKRTIPQNRLYWLWLTCLMDETGNSREDLHIYFKEKFLPSQTELFNNVEIVKTSSTTSLNTKEFKFYLERIHQFAATELEIYLPWPEDPVFKEFDFKYRNYI